MKNGTATLSPYPSWEMQEIGNMSALQYVQSMEIDSRGWMWILDVGRLNILDYPQYCVNQYGKLVIWDTNSNCLIREFVFPDYVSGTDTSFLNDIVVDESNGFAYMTETWGNGGIVVYDFSKNEARRFNDPTLAGNNSALLTIQGIAYNITSPSGEPSFLILHQFMPNPAKKKDGIALSHDTKTLYYCSLSTNLLFSVPTSYLQNFSLNDQQIASNIISHGVKGFSDGMVFSSNGRLYFGSLEEDAVYVCNPREPLSNRQILFHNSSTCQWQDSHYSIFFFIPKFLFSFLSSSQAFAFDLKGNLYWVSNKLQR